MLPNYEMFIRGHRVKARLRPDHFAIQRRHPYHELVDNSLQICFVNLAVDTFGRAHYIAAVNGRLDSTQRPVYCRKAIPRIAAIGVFA